MVTDNETWLIEIGDVVIRKKASHGVDSLLPWEHLVYCLWVVDYGMRNAGDLGTAADVDPHFHTEGKRLAAELALPLTRAAFALSKRDLERQYLDNFESICDEMKQARPTTAVDVRVRRMRGKQGPP